jgi:hypothetical protein
VQVSSAVAEQRLADIEARVEANQNLPQVEDYPRLSLLDTITQYRAVATWSASNTRSRSGWMLLNAPLLALAPGIGNVSRRLHQTKPDYADRSNKPRL